MSAKILLVSCGFFISILSQIGTSQGRTLSRNPDELEMLVVTIATEETDGYKRFMRSCKHYNLSVRVIGMHEEWKGGDIQRYPGGGHKINMLKKVIGEYKDKHNLLLMFSDSYDAIFLANATKIIKTFLEFDKQMVFSAEGFCWPNRWLVDKYPEISHGKRYLCSGGFMGYASVFHDVVTDNEIKDDEDDQLYYTNLYLNEKKREKYEMALDHTTKIFQNLNGAEEEIEVEIIDTQGVTVRNTVHNTVPLWVHGNGPSKIFLNYIGNYVPAAWHPDLGCTACNEDTVNLKKKKDNELPTIMLAIFIRDPTPFMPEFFQKIDKIDYPKKRIDLYIHNLAEYHSNHVADWLKGGAKGLYRTVTNIGSSSLSDPGDKEFVARNKIIEAAIKSGNDYLFYVNSEVSITNKDTLKLLISQNRGVMVPMLSRYGKLWSNFWGAIGDDGYYTRSPDYLDIVQYKRMGVWNSPYICSAYLIKKEVLPKIRHSHGHPNFDPDIAFSKYVREKGIFMYVSNLHYFGHLKNSDTYFTAKLHNDLWQIFNNQLDWEERYLHPNYSKNLNESIPMEMPCPDVYWFPLYSETWAKHMIEEMEHYGQWSGGKNVDARLAGGYENVPTVDIHMNQVGFEAEWLHSLKQYVVPVNSRIFTGYHSDARATMNFVVKYQPSGQYYLRPHHDSSTYTINIGLNRPGIDYGGGGSRFIRQDCAVSDTKVGWAIMHPGRLTHFHEGLPTTWGTRYIMVCFIDP